MKKTNSGATNRLTQVAEELHRIANSIGKGHVKISGVDVSISESVTLKVKQKMTGKKVIFDLKIQAQLAGDEIVSSAKPNSKQKKHPKKKSSDHSERPYGVKPLKKKYTALWRQVSGAIKKGECPEVSLVADLEDVSKEYGETAPPEWASLWLEHETIVRKCIEQAQAGNLNLAQKSLAEIGQLKKNCHKKFK